jgi:hypothetical protein
MTTSHMPEPRQRYYKNNGAVAAGCLLYTYAAGTATPKATYTDYAGTIPHDNPIVLDSKGEALIYWNGAYKVDLMTAELAQVTGYPVDNFVSVNSLISASDATLRADLAANTGGGLSGFEFALLPAAINKIDWAIRTISENGVSILRYIDPSEWAGLMAGTSTFNCTTAFLAIIAALPGGGVIDVPSGKFKITQKLILHSGLTIQGISNVDPYYGTKTGSEKATYIWQATAGEPVFKIGEGVCDVNFKNFSAGPVQTPSAVTTATAGQYGIEFEGTYPASSYRFGFEHVTFYNFERAISVNGLAGAQGWQCDGVSVKCVNFFNNTIGVYFNTINADWWHFDTCGWLVPNSGDGVYVKQVGFLNFANCVAGPTGAGTSADFMHIEERYDQIKFTGCQVESMANWLHVDTTTGFENVFYPIILDDCIVEAPITLARKCRFVSINSRYTEDVTASGDDVLIESTNDVFLGADYITSGLRPIVRGRMRPWTPVPVPTSGAITTYTSLGQYHREGDKVTVSFQINITDVGTATSLSSISGLPCDSDSYGLLSIGAGRESGTTGLAWQFYIGPGQVSVINGKAYNNDPAIVTGTILHGTLTYFAIPV